MIELLIISNGNRTAIELHYGLGLTSGTLTAGDDALWARLEKRFVWIVLLRYPRPLSMQC